MRIAAMGDTAVGDADILTLIAPVCSSLRLPLLP